MPIYPIGALGAKAGRDATTGIQGFIAHYITGVLYPASWTTAVHVVVLAIRVCPARQAS